MPAHLGHGCGFVFAGRSGMYREWWPTTSQAMEIVASKTAEVCMSMVRRSEVLVPRIWSGRAARRPHGTEAVSGEVFHTQGRSCAPRYAGTFHNGR